MKSKSLEGALAELEAKKTQTAEYAAKHAPELEAAMAKQNALNERLAALTQKERRKVLDAAGLKHISAAPPPLEPLRSSGYTRPSKALEPIDWEHWRLMRDGEVPLWQAVALSVNVNPDAVPMDKAGDDFNKRLRVALAHANTGSLPLSVHYPNQPVSPLILAQFAAWAVKLNIPNMPPELVAMAETKPEAVPETTSEPPAPPVVSVGASEPQATTLSPVPVLAETVEQRRARYLAMFEAEEKRDRRGALQRVADSEGIDRSNMRKDINKALAARDKQKRAGFFVSQLVQDGKRMG